MTDAVSHIERLLHQSPLKIATKEAINGFMHDLIEKEDLLESAIMLPSANNLKPDQILLVVMYGERKPSAKDVMVVETKIAEELKGQGIEACVYGEFTRDTAKHDGEPTCWATFLLVNPLKQCH